MWFVLMNIFSVSDVLLTLILIFLLILNNKTIFTRIRVCPITSPLPVGEISAHMAVFYCQNIDFL